MSHTFAAVDLGASSGRVMVGQVTEGVVDLQEVNRFGNHPVRVNGTLQWDILSLYRGLLDGLVVAGRHPGGLVGVGIDTWAVDYGLLDADGALLGNPVHYRDARTDGVAAKVIADAGADRLYATTGLQTQPFNTLFQLAAARGSAQLAAARRLLLIPDLLAYWLTGVQGAELTNASTTQLLDVRQRDWAPELLAGIGIDVRLLPPVREPGIVIGPVLAEIATQLGLGSDVPVIAVGSHDTASAIVAVPAQRADFAYISCGTWSLVGVELAEPVLTEASRQANFTNELGVDGTVRYLKNVMGLWMLSESIRAWQSRGMRVELADLLGQAARIRPLRTVVDAASPTFLAPGDMPERIIAAAAATSQPIPASPAEIVRCILDSLALAYRGALRQASELSGHQIGVVHLVGGGVRNHLLCQLTADATGLPVVAGPVEGAALGNVLIQARTVGALPGDLADLRAVAAASSELHRYEPGPDHTLWAEAEARLAR